MLAEASAAASTRWLSGHLVHEVLAFARAREERRRREWWWGTEGQVERVELPRRASTAAVNDEPTAAFATLTTASDSHAAELALGAEHFSHSDAVSIRLVACEGGDGRQ